MNICLLSEGDYGDLFDINRARYSSYASLLDFDAVIVDPLSALSLLHRKNPEIASEDSARSFLEITSRRKKDLSDFLDHRRPVVYLTPGFRPFKRFSINLEESLVPFEISSLETGRQIEIEPSVKEPFQSFLRNTLDLFFYMTTILEVDYFNPLLLVRGTSKVIAAFMWGNTEKTILLPYVDLSDYNNRGRFFSEVTRLLRALESPADKGRLPDSHNLYLLPGESDLMEQLTSFEGAKRDLEQRAQFTQSLLDQRLFLKHLFLSKSEILEDAVRNAFDLLGFNVRRGETGRADLEGEFEGRSVVIEVKGKDGSAAEKDAAQLEKWVMSALSDTGSQPKGILVINGFASSPLVDRTEPIFPPQMVPMSVSRGHVLVSGVNLLRAVLFAETDDTRRIEIANRILDTVGVFAMDEFPIGDLIVRKPAQSR